MDILGIVDINGWIITLFSLCLTAFFLQRGLLIHLGEGQIWVDNSAAPLIVPSIDIFVWDIFYPTDKTRRKNANILDQSTKYGKEMECLDLSRLLSLELLSFMRGIGYADQRNGFHFIDKHYSMSCAGASINDSTSEAFLPIPYSNNKGQDMGLAKTDQELVRKYGRFVGMYQGHVPTLLISDPETIKSIMVKDFASFPNRLNLIRSKNEFKHALINVEDDHWRFMRNTLLPTFSSGKMRMMNPLFKRKYEQLLEGLKPKAEAGIPIEFKEIYGAYTMDVIASTGFGMDIDSQKNPENNFTKYAKILFNISFSPLVILLLIFPSSDVILDWLKISPNNNRTVMDFFKSVVTRAIEMRDEGDQKRKDLLQLMINAHNDTDVNDDESQHDYQNDPNIWKKRGLTLDEVTGNAILFMLVGYDTTSNALTFASYCLATNPDCQEKLIEEIDSKLGKESPDYDNIQKLEYLDHVLSETLRLYPSASRTNRKADKDLVINGYKVPKNTDISFPIYAIHRDPEFWDEPEKFDPERFTPENKAKRHPYTYLPFGHGPRSCIGMRLAQLETKYALVYILQHYRFKTCKETEIPVQISKAGLIQPQNGMKLKLEAR